MPKYFSFTFMLLVSWQAYAQKATPHPQNIPLNCLPVYTSLAEALKEPNRVYRLQLAGKGYVRFPKEIFRFKNLRWLNLGWKDENHNKKRDHGEPKNHLSVLPKEIFLLQKLEYFDLSYNRLVEVPAEIGLLRNLKHLKLSWNVLMEVPAEIGQLKKLSALHLTHNHLSHLPPAISQLQNLTYLSLGRNQITQFPLQLLNCQQLQVLQISNNPLTKLPNALGSLTQLKRIYFYNCALKTLPTSIGKLNQLEMLSIYGNQLQHLPESIGKLKKLKVLSVHHNQLNTLPASIGKLSSLRVLRAHYNKICELPVSIGQLKHLKQLNLRANQLTSLPLSIRQITSLSLFDVEKNKNIYIPYTLYDWVSANHNGLSPTIRDRVHQSELKKLKQQIAQEKENQALQNAQKKRTQTFWWLATISLTVFVLILVTSKNARKEKQAKQQIDTQAKKLAVQHEETLQQTQALQDNIAALKELQEFRRKVWAMITHDLKNPLDIIIGLSEVSINHKNLAMIKEAGQRMTQLIEGLLEVKNIENIQVPLAMDGCQLSTLVETSLAQVHWLAQAKNITIHYVKAPAEIKADPMLIIRVLVNLLNNAIKYSQAHQTITIDTTHEAQQVGLVITDEGAGISQAQQASIFEEYYQNNPQKAFQTNSTGLGLAFCKMVINAHQGNIGVNSTVGKGSSFWFTLPLASQTSAPTLSATNFSNNTFQLTVEEKKQLMPYLTLLSKQTVHQFTRVDNILAQIDTQNNENLGKWVGAVKEAVDTCCEDAYKQLTTP